MFTVKLYPRWKPHVVLKLFRTTLIPLYLATFFVACRDIDLRITTPDGPDLELQDAVAFRDSVAPMRVRVRLIGRVVPPVCLADTFTSQELRPPDSLYWANERLPTESTCDVGETPGEVSYEFLIDSLPSESFVLLADPGRGKGLLKRIPAPFQ